MTIDYMFRKPKFPVIGIIGDIEGQIITARSTTEFERRLGKVEIEPDVRYSIIDSTGAEWLFFPNKMFMMPWPGKKWSKKKIIRTYNQSTHCAQLGNPYSEKSLSSKRFEVVFADIVGLIEQSQKLSR
jgi:hypothetical protein